MRRRLLRRNATLMAPGIYFFGSARLWYRVNLDERSGIDLPKRRQTLRSRFLDVLTGPSFVRPGLGQGGGSSALFVSREDVIALNPSSLTATRVLTQPISHEYELMRRRLQRYIPGPQFRIEENRLVIVEEFVHGKQLRSHDFESQIRAVRDLLVRLSSLVRCEQVRIHDASIDRQVISTLVQKGYQRDAATEAVTGLLDVPWVPSHGDMAPTNIVLTSLSPSSMVVLDWEPKRLQLRPFWYDPISPPLKDWWLSFNSTPLLDAYEEGSFDGELMEIARSAGESCDFFTSQRAELSACYSALNRLMG